MSDKALHIVQHAAQEDKDFVASMEEYRNVIPGTKDTGKTRSVSHKPPQVEGPKELDGGYFALIGNMSKLSLLQQVSTLEEENAALTLALNETKEDAVVYAEVAREMENDYDTMMAKVTAAEEATLDALKRLADAEAVIEALTAQQLEASRPALEQIEPASARDLQRDSVTMCRISRATEEEVAPQATSDHDRSFP